MKVLGDWTLMGYALDGYGFPIRGMDSITDGFHKSRIIRLKSAAYEDGYTRDLSLG